MDLTVDAPHPVRMTPHTRLILLLFLSDPGREWYSYGLTRRLGFSEYSISGILRRLAAAGWLAGSVEDASPSALGRPRRHNYRLTDAGAARGRATVVDGLPPFVLELANALDLSVDMCTGQDP